MEFEVRSRKIENTGLSNSPSCINLSKTRNMSPLKRLYLESFLARIVVEDMPDLQILQRERPVRVNDKLFNSKSS